MEDDTALTIEELLDDFELLFDEFELFEEDDCELLLLLLLELELDEEDELPLLLLPFQLLT